MKRVRPTPVGQMKKQVRKEESPLASRRQVTIQEGGTLLV